MEFRRLAVGEASPLENVGAWLAQHETQSKALEDVEYVPVDGPHDGESFCFETPKEAVECLLHLRYVGYHVPEYAIEALKKEE